MLLFYLIFCTWHHFGNYSRRLNCLKSVRFSSVLLNTSYVFLPGHRNSILIKKYHITDPHVAVENLSKRHNIKIVDHDWYNLLLQKICFRFIHFSAILFALLLVESLSSYVSSDMFLYIFLYLYVRAPSFSFRMIDGFSNK